MRFGLPILLLSLLAADCAEEPPPTPPADTEPEWATRAAGELQAGASQSYLNLPVGLPLGAFTGRDRALGSADGPDLRDSDYTTDFQPSGGWHTRINANGIWLDNGHAQAAILQLDIAYSFDGLTEELGRRLSDATGLDLTDSVFTVTNHSHSSYGTFSGCVPLFLGTDFFREETLERVVEQGLQILLDAHDAARPAAIGVGIDPLFDPVGDDSIFRDRREENDDLPSPDGTAHGVWKDQRATLLRIDGTDGEPIAALYAFGIHGTVMGEDNPLITGDAPGVITTYMNQRHPGPVWLFAQGAGGDASPGGPFGGFPKMEAIAEVAAPRLLALWEATETTSDPIELEGVQRLVPLGRDISVTRHGAADFRYIEFDPEWTEDPYEPDEEVFNDPACIEQWQPGCEVITPIDEFWPEFGGVFCGDPDLNLSILGLNLPDLPMYASCLDATRGRALLAIAFPEYWDTTTDIELPLGGTETTLLGALGLGGVPVTTLGEGTEVSTPVFSFAPGEVTTFWAEALRARAQEFEGIEHTVSLGYALDHEGYLLTIEDWMQAGYEPTITWWGPLQGEYILERMEEVVEIAFSPELEDPLWPDWPTEQTYTEWDTPFVEPDETPEAGELATPLPEQFYTWDGTLPADAVPPATVRRIQEHATWTFWGNDPATGLVEVVLEHEGTEGWSAVETPGGVVNDALPDLIVTYTPFPLTGNSDDRDPVRDHLFHVDWQAVNTWGGLDERGALPLGNYRFTARGESRDPADSDWPYDTLPWQATSPSFEVVPAQVEATAELTGQTLTLRAAYGAAPRGFRLLHMTSHPQTRTPLAGELTVALRAVAGDADDIPLAVEGQVSEDGDDSVLAADVGAVAAGEYFVVVADGHGNEGLAQVSIP